MDQIITTPATQTSDATARASAAEAYLAECRAESIRHWIRRLTAEIEREGYARVDRQLTTWEYPTDAIRYTVWRLDSLLWAFEEYAAGRALYAFRALLQVAEYSGHVAHNCVTSDATITLRNLIEDVVRKGES